MPPPTNGAEVDLGELLGGADQEAADDGAERSKSKPPSTSTGSAFSTTSESENWTPSRAPQRRPATSATKPAAVQTMAQIRGRREADGERGELVVGDGAEGEADAGERKKTVSAATMAAATAAANRSNWLMKTPCDLERQVVDAEVEAVHLRAPDRAGRAPSMT